MGHLVWDYLQILFWFFYVLWNFEDKTADWLRETSETKIGI